MLNTPDTQIIAIVDDDVFMAQIIAKMVTKLGFVAEIHHSATSILEAKKSSKYLAMVIDLAMPDIDGIELMGKLAGLPPVDPLVIISGLDQATIDTAAILGENYGITVLGTLTKPIEYTEFSSLIEKAVELSQ